MQQIRAKSKARAAERAEIAELRAAILAKLTYFLGKDRQRARDHDWFVATALTVRDRIIERWLESDRRAEAERKKRVYYLSIEYLIGRLLFDTLTNLGLIEAIREALAGFEIDLEHLRTLESDAGLGTGGLGRLAACYLDSTASLGVPAHGYGIRYEHGLFRQQFTNGWQSELPDDWLANGNPWELPRSDLAYPVRFGGMVEYLGGDGDTARGIWYPPASGCLRAVCGKAVPRCESVRSVARPPAPGHGVPRLVRARGPRPIPAPPRFVSVLVLPRVRSQP